MNSFKTTDIQETKTIQNKTIHKMKIFRDF